MGIAKDAKMLLGPNSNALKIRALLLVRMLSCFESEGHLPPSEMSRQRGFNEGQTCREEP